MKNNISRTGSTIMLFIMALLVVGYFTPTYARNKTWKLIWQDNFSGKKLDTNVWGYMKRGQDDSRKYHSSDPRCYDFKNGKIIIKGIKNPDMSKDTATYLTGGITTQGKKAFASGRIEIRAKLQNAKGAWPAFWLMPFVAEKGWPADGELDIMEHLNYDDKVYQTIHSSYTKAHPNIEPNRYVLAPINPNKFNIYRIDILSDRIDYYINDKKTLTYPKIDTLLGQGQYPFIRDWYLMLDMQLGGSWVGSIDPKDLPVQMEIDWVKYYQLK